MSLATKDELNELRIELRSLAGLNSDYLRHKEIIAWLRQLEAKLSSLDERLDLLVRMTDRIAGWKVSAIEPEKTDV